MKIYCIYDKVAELCGNVFNAKNDGVAKRIFADTVNRVMVKQKNISLDDFSLVSMCTYDEETGIIMIDDKFKTVPQEVMKACDVLYDDDAAVETEVEPISAEQIPRGDE